MNVELLKELPAPEPPVNDKPYAGSRHERNEELMEFAKLLREHPRMWGAIPGGFSSKNSAGSAKSNIARGRYAAFSPASKWESAQRGTDVWVRFVP